MQVSHHPSLLRARSMLAMWQGPAVKPQAMIKKQIPFDFPCVQHRIRENPSIFERQMKLITRAFTKPPCVIHPAPQISLEGSYRFHDLSCCVNRKMVWLYHALLHKIHEHQMRLAYATRFGGGTAFAGSLPRLSSALLVALCRFQLLTVIPFLPCQSPKYEVLTIAHVSSCAHYL